jgi:hypothetical protein
VGLKYNEREARDLVQSYGDTCLELEKCGKAETEKVLERLKKQAEDLIVQLITE